MNAAVNTKRMFVILSMFLVFLAVDAQATISNFMPVTNNIYRGGRPQKRDLENLKDQKNLSTIIDVENKPAVAQEKDAADRLGLKFISSPMDTDIRPSDQQVDQILTVMSDPHNFPIFIHCFHGEDRTGLIVGLFRVEVQGWSAQSAYLEMLKNGFHPKYRALDKYFRDRTGYSGR